MELNSGVQFSEAQVALARQWIGNQHTEQKEVKIKVPKNTQEGQSLSENTESDILTVKFPDTVEEATAIIKKFEEGSREIRGDEEVADTVSQHMLQDKTSLFDEKWLGSEEEELNKWVAFAYGRMGRRILMVCQLRLGVALHPLKGHDRGRPSGHHG